MEQHLVPQCHWRTAAETLDVVEALERMESVLMQMAERVRRIEERMPAELVASARYDRRETPAAVEPRGGP